MAAKRTTTAATHVSPLSIALDHVKIASTGPANYAEYCRFETGWVIGYDGIIAAGHAAQENLHVAPNTELFRHAVMRAGTPYAITQLTQDKIRVSGNKVRAEIPCFALANVPNVMPDRPVHPINACLSSVLIDVSKLIEKKADTVIGSSMLLRSNSVVATDGQTVVEGYHGLKIPTLKLVPREFAEALSKVKEQPTACGWGQDTFTVWYGDTKWLRTTTYEGAEQYPDTDVYFAAMISNRGDLRPVPVDLLQSIETLKPFRETPNFTVMEYGLNTRIDGAGASMSFEHYWPYRGEYPTAGLRMVAAHGQWIAFGPQGAFWYGPVIRGIAALQA